MPLLMFKEIGEGVLILPGSPTTLIVPYDNGYWVVDPGYPRERAKDITKIGRIEGILLTHFHSDHVNAAIDLKAKKFAPLIETGPILSSKMRLSMSYGASSTNKLLPLVAEDVHVDVAFNPPLKLGPGRVIPLPGHTFGQVGYVTDSGIFYAADAFFGDKLLKTVKIPFYLDYVEALKTLYWIRERVREFERLVPSHGPIVEGRRAEKLLDLNIEVMEELPKKVLEVLSSKPLSAEGITAKIVRSDDPTSVVLSSVTVKSVLSMLFDKGEVKPIVEDGLLWKLA